MDRKTALKMLWQIIEETTRPKGKPAPRQTKIDREAFSAIRELARDLAGMIRTDKSITD